MMCNNIDTSLNHEDFIYCFIYHITVKSYYKIGVLFVWVIPESVIVSTFFVIL